jgi:hypothetical protein
MIDHWLVQGGERDQAQGGTKPETRVCMEKDGVNPNLFFFINREWCGHRQTKHEQKKKKEEKGSPVFES